MSATAQRRLVVLGGIILFGVVMLVWGQALLDGSRGLATYETNRPTRGEGAIVVRTYSDFSCSHCRELATILDRLIATYPQQLTIEFRYVPLTNASLLVDVAAECAQQEGNFWAYHDQLFSHGGVGTVEDLIAWGLAVDLTTNFEACLRDQATLPIVQYDAAQALQRGVSGSPTVLVDGQEVPWQKLEQTIQQTVATTP